MKCPTQVKLFQANVNITLNNIIYIQTNIQQISHNTYQQINIKENRRANPETQTILGTSDKQKNAKQKTKKMYPTIKSGLNSDDREG